LVRELACLPVIGAPAFRLMLRCWLSTPRTFRSGLRSAMGTAAPDGEMPLGVLRDLRRSDPRCLHGMALWLRGWRGLLEPDGLDVPVFSIICADDPVVHPAQQLALAQALGRARAVMLPSGHLPMIERPEAFCDALRRWLGTPAIRFAAVRRSERHVGTTGFAATLRL
jgi:pimeloyl-ACP methyl ester carboxylesterase